MDDATKTVPDTTSQLIAILPELLWFCLAVIAMIIFYKPLTQLLLSLSNLKMGTVELSFVQKAMDSALELAKKSPQWNVSVSKEDKAIILARAKRNRAMIEGKKVLWVDDSPQNNINEIRMFRQLNIDVVSARSTPEALEMLSQDKFDVIFSDMARSSNTSGIEMLAKLKTTTHKLPVIFYVGILNPDKGTPPGAFGLTNRPDELLHLFIDAMSRS